MLQAMVCTAECHSFQAVVDVHDTKDRLLATFLCLRIPKEGPFLL